jgi:hypothetical protein
MPGPALPLNETGSVTLDSSGDGTVQLGPAGPAEHWFPTGASVKASSNTAEASCKIFIGAAVADQNYVDGTLSGSTGDSTDAVAGYEVARTRDPYIFAVWAGGDAGAQATLQIIGTKTVQ